MAIKYFLYSEEQIKEKNTSNPQHDAQNMELQKLPHFCAKLLKAERIIHSAVLKHNDEHRGQDQNRPRICPDKLN